MMRESNVRQWATLMTDLDVPFNEEDFFESVVRYANEVIKAESVDISLPENAEFTRFVMTRKAEQHYWDMWKFTQHLEWSGAFIEATPGTKYKMVFPISEKDLKIRLSEDYITREELQKGYHGLYLEHRVKASVTRNL